MCVCGLSSPTESKSPSLEFRFSYQQKKREKENFYGRQEYEKKNKQKYIKNLLCSPIIYYHQSMFIWNRCITYEIIQRRLAGPFVCSSWTRNTERSLKCVPVSCDALT